MSPSLPLVRTPVSRRLPLLGIGLAGLLGVTAYLLALSWPSLFPVALYDASAANCDLRAGPCVAAFDERRFVRLALEPNTLPASEPLRVRVDTAGFTADSASIQFSGVDMNMGLIRAELSDVGGGSFAGDAVLPVCIRRRMTWKALVEVSTGGARYRATYPFEVRAK